MPLKHINNIYRIYDKRFIDFSITHLCSCVIEKSRNHLSYKSVINKSYTRIKTYKDIHIKNMDNLVKRNHRIV